MSWRDQGYGDENPADRYGRPGGDWQGVRPSFDNPFTWAVPIGRMFGIDVRLHIFFLIFFIIMLLRAAVQTEGGVAVSMGIMALAMVILFGIVLLHEFGHCIACRYTGGEANEVLMWPLGGLAFTRPPHHWKAHMITVVGGPAVNVAICLVAGLTLGLMSGFWLGVAIPNPFALVPPLEIAHSWSLQVLYLINTISFILLLFNLLPMFPLDGGRIVQAALWPRLGYVRSMRIAIRVGFIGAICLGIFAAVTYHMMLLAIAIFGAVTCWLTHKQLAFTEEMMGPGGSEQDDYALSLAYGNDDTGTDEKPRKPTRAERRRAKQAQREQEEAREVDRILQKIATNGMDSLNRREKQLLKRATERKRQEK